MKGFTLIELLVSIALVALVTAVALPNFRQLSKDQDVNNATSQLVNILRRAQSSASSRIQCLPTNVSSNWQVTLNTSTTNDSYTLNCLGSSPQTLYQIYNSAFAQTPTSTTTFQATTVPCAGENMTIYFTNQQASYQCTSTPSPLPIPVGNITITINPSGTTSKQVIIESGGSIR